MISNIKSWIVLSAAVFGLHACTVPLPEGTEIHHNQSYGPHNRNKLDVYLPEQRDTTTEMVVLIHGGAWVTGDKGTADLMRKRNAFLDAGYAVASMNYRFANGDYHNQMEDVGNALELIRSEATGWLINRDRFALYGISAGGHLALLYGHAFDQNGVIKTVVSNVGPTNFTSTLFHSYAANYNLMWTLEQLLGETYETDSALWAEASPLFNASDCPSFFIYGGQDDLVPKEQGIAMFDTLIANGVAADTTIPAQGTHNVNGPNNMYRDQLLNETVNWLDVHLNQ
ncbi:MAG: alpha/beta hydrolase [Flavobacteriales bacterium]|jgi:acetyl esterase/lipase|nr:alpha/beta hydrolase [Flavobacteriales bacterium]